MKKILSVAFIAFFLTVIVADFYYTDQFQTDIPNPVKDDAAIQNLIRSFGSQLKQVSLLATPDQVQQDIDNHYKDFLTPALLANWKNNPAQALGKMTSSPWPDHINDIFLRKVSGDTYSVTATIIEYTSDDIAQHKPGMAESVVFTVMKTTSGWRIAAAKMTGITSTPTHTPTNTPTVAITPVIPPIISWQTFRNPDITLLHPANFLIRQNEESSGGNFLDTAIVKISFPENAFANENTNFNEAYLVVSKSHEKMTSAACTTFAGTLQSQSTTTHQETINTVPFVEKDFSDAAAGNIYNSKVYRTFHKNTCYEIALTLHTGNIHNFEPGVQEFNKAEAFDALKQILTTFHFVS